MRITPCDAWIAERIGATYPLERGAIEAYQLAALNNTLAYVQTNKHYRKTIGDVRLSALSELSSLPFTTAADLRASGRLLCTSSAEISRIVTLDTSGTTGVQKRVFFTRDDQELTIDYFHRGMETLLNPHEHMLVLLPCAKEGGVGDLILRGVSRIPAEGIAHGLIKSLPEALEVLVNSRAETLVGMPVQALALARYCEATNQRVNLKRILLSADSLPGSIKRELERIWGAQVFEHYGMTEMGLGGGIDCIAHEGYHMREADFIFEIVHPGTGEALPDGETGEVVFTTLTRRGMPLIRYRTGDTARLLKKRCACGSALKLMERLGGRLDAETVVGSNQISMAMLDEALFALPGVIEFSARAAGDRLYVELFVLNAAKQKPREGDVRAAMAGVCTEVKITPVDDMVCVHRGKRTIVR